MISPAEENYLKAIYKIVEKEPLSAANTNTIASAMQTSAASVTDMVKRLSDKNLLTYEKYRGVQLTDEGKRIAKQLIRRHRLWEVFLLEKLGFSWDEVHLWAEELEHIPDDRLTDRLDAFLGFPKFDPHGDPIPDASGNIIGQEQILLAHLSPGALALVTGVDDHSPKFLQYLDTIGLVLGTTFRLMERIEYDNSLKIKLLDGKELMLSEKVGQHLFVKETG